MPAGNPEDKDRYSYSEIMDRLEKVKAAGKRGVKSKKKKKRRTHQPVYEKRKRRWIGIGIFLFIAIPLLAILIGHFIFSYMFYRSDKFREQISLDVSHRLNAVGSFPENFSANKFRFGNSNFTGEGAKGTSIDQIEAQHLDIRLDPRSLFSKDWAINLLKAESFELRLRPVQSSVQAENVPAPELARRIGGLPASLGVRRFSARDFDLYFGSNRADLHGITNGKLILNRHLGGFTGTLSEATLDYGFLPSIKMKDVEFFMDGNQGLVIQTAVGETEGKGVISVVEGKIDLKKSQTVSLDLNVEQLPLNEVVSMAVRKHFLGTLTGRLKMNGSIHDDGTNVLSGPVTLERFAIRGLPFLKTLAQYTRLQALQRLDFDSFTAHLEISDQGLALTRLGGGSGSQFEMKGTLQCPPDGSLNGVIAFGLGKAALEDFDQAEKERFTESEDDSFFWRTIAIGGTLEKPIFDVEEQMIAAAEKRRDNYKPKSKSVLERFNEEGKTPPKKEQP